MSKKGSSDVFVSVALGSRDRSFSIWSTDLKRPLIVINDVFDQSVLDLSWSRDGKVSNISRPRPHPQRSMQVLERLYPGYTVHTKPRSNRLKCLFNR